MTPGPRRNEILAALPRSAQERLAARLESLRLPAGAVLVEAGESIEYAYFPVDCVVSFLYPMENGGSAEYAVVGHEGVVGVSLFMSDGIMPSRVVVRCEGRACRLPAGDLLEEFNRKEDFHRILLRYTQARLIQTSQTAVCNQYHLLDRRLCRCLLSYLDRLPTTRVRITHQAIADVLGVHRGGVTRALGELQRLGAIRMGRGTIDVLDPRALEEGSCECYAALRSEYARLLSNAS